MDRVIVNALTDCLPVFGSETEVEETHPKKKVLVLGSGPIRIGQGIEFDYCC